MRLVLNEECGKSLEKRGVAHMHILEKHATHAFFAASRSGSCLGRRVQESGSNLERDLYSHYALCTEIRRKDESMEGVAEVMLGLLVATLVALLHRFSGTIFNLYRT